MEPHLTPERLAALADEPATVAERAHLHGCAACAAQLAAVQRVVRMALTDVPAIARPLTSWDALAPRLRREGLIAPGAGSTWRVARGWWQAAAGLALVVGGAAVGRATAGAPLALPVGATIEPVAAAPAGFRTRDEALQTLSVAQTQYQSAAAWLAARDSLALPVHDPAAALRTRLTVLDEAAAAARAALYQAPDDPVLTEYYLATLGARAATLRQLTSTAPTAPARARF